MIAVLRVWCTLSRAEARVVEWAGKDSKLKQPDRFPAKGRHLGSARGAGDPLEPGAAA